MVPQIGLLWSEFRQRFPKVQQHAPITPVVERLGATSDGPSLQLVPPKVTPRVWFVDQNERELVQVQPDRFIRNWKKVDDSDEYPRYDNHVRPRFLSDLNQFLAFLSREKLEEFKPNQCEVTYINHLVSGEGWENHADLGQIFTGWKGFQTKIDLPELEDVRVATRHLLKDQHGEFIGRLHIAVEPGVRKSDDKQAFAMTLTARGKPPAATVEGVMSFMDFGREVIVRGFKATTSKGLHDIWEEVTDE